MIVLPGQVVSLRDQIKRRQQGLDNGKEVTPAGGLSSVLEYPPPFKFKERESFKMAPS